MIELLYFDDCPGYEVFEPRLRELLAEAGLDVQIRRRRVESDAAAQSEHFLGSPTLRVNGTPCSAPAVEPADPARSCSRS